MATKKTKPPVKAESKADADKPIGEIGTSFKPPQYGGMIDVGGFRAPFLELTGWANGEALPDHVQQAYWVFRKLCCAASRGEHDYAQCWDPGFGRYNAELIAELYRDIYVMEYASRRWWLRLLCRCIEDAAERFHANKEQHEQWVRRSVELAPTLARWSDDPTVDVQEGAIHSLINVFAMRAEAERVDAPFLTPFPSMTARTAVRIELERLSPNRDTSGRYAASPVSALARLSLAFGLFDLRPAGFAEAAASARAGNPKELRIMERRARERIKSEMDERKKHGQRVGK